MAGDGATHASADLVARPRHVSNDEGRVQAARQAGFSFLQNEAPNGSGATARQKGVAATEVYQGSIGLRTRAMRSERGVAAVGCGGGAAPR